MSARASFDAASTCTPRRFHRRIGSISHVPAPVIMWTWHYHRFNVSWAIYECYWATLEATNAEASCNEQQTTLHLRSSKIVTSHRIAYFGYTQFPRVDLLTCDIWPFRPRIYFSLQRCACFLLWNLPSCQIKMYKLKFGCERSVEFLQRSGQQADVGFVATTLHSRADLVFYCFVA